MAYIHPSLPYFSDNGAAYPSPLPRHSLLPSPTAPISLTWTGERHLPKCRRAGVVARRERDRVSAAMAWTKITGMWDGGWLEE